jgi:hypothetical protein
MFIEYWYFLNITKNYQCIKLSGIFNYFYMSIQCVQLILGKYLEDSSLHYMLFQADMEIAIPKETVVYQSESSIQRRTQSIFTIACKGILGRNIV